MYERLQEGLRSEHRRMDAILEDVRYLVEHQSYASAAKRFGEFRREQARRFDAEASLLSYLAPEAPQLALLRAEHHIIEAMMEETLAAISQWNPRSFLLALSGLETRLALHEAQEERTLFGPDPVRCVGDADGFQRELERFAAA